MLLFPIFFSVHHAYIARIYSSAKRQSQSSIFLDEWPLLPIQPSSSAIKMLLTLLFVSCAIADSPFDYFKDWIPKDTATSPEVIVAPSSVVASAAGSVTTVLAQAAASTSNTQNSGVDNPAWERLLGPGFVWPGQDLSKAATLALRAVNEQG